MSDQPPGDGFDDPPLEQGQSGQHGNYAPQRQPGGRNTSAIVLTVVSALSCLVGIFPAGLSGLVLGIVALTKQRDDLPASHRFSRIGWIVWSSITLISITAFVAWVASGNFSFGG